MHACTLVQSTAVRRSVDTRTWSVGAVCFGPQHTCLCYPPRIHLSSTQPLPAPQEEDQVDVVQLDHV